MSFVEQANRTPMTFIVLLAYVTFAFVVDPTSGEKGLVAYGACVGVLVQEGELWRLLSYAFLHGGMMHLVFNSFGLLVLGPGLESMLGSARFTLLYAVTALGGSIAGCLWHSPITPLVGGSGALFGMMGVALALLMRQGRHPLEFLNYGGPRLLVSILVVNLLIGLVVPFISNAAHIGGLVSGFALGFCFLARRRDAPDTLSRVIQAGWIALTAALLLYVSQPVLRWDHLDEQMRRAVVDDDLPQARAYARALLRATDDFRALPRGVFPADKQRAIRLLARGG